MFKKTKLKCGVYMNARKEGSITVFLSLIMLLVLSILMTTIEVARVSSYQVHTNRALIAAMDSVLADFYYPLYEEYHVFALDGSYDADTGTSTNASSTNSYDTNVSTTNSNGNIKKEQIESLVTNYMEYTFVPDKNLIEELNELGNSLLNGNADPNNTEILEDDDAKSNKDAIDYSLIIEYTHILDYFNLYGIKTKEVEALDIATLLDYEGEYFRTQAVDYMKYASVGKGLDFILEALIPMKETKTTGSIVKEKQKTEDCITELEEYILELMSYIDGIQVGKKGVSVNRNGYLNVKNSFVKKICPHEITMAGTGINNEWVFASLRNEYINPNVYVQNQMTWISGLTNTMAQKLAAETQYRYYSLIDRDAIKDKKELEDLDETIKGLELQIDAYGKEIDGYLNNINGENNKLKTLVRNTNKSIESALNVIDKVIDKQKTASKSIDEYEIYLNEKKGEVSEALFESLLEDFVMLSKYKGSEDNSNKNGKYDLLGMKETLLMNQTLLDSIQANIDTYITSSESSIASYSNMLRLAKQEINQYSFKNLSIDYTSMQKPMESESFFKRIKEVFETGVVGLVLEDTSKLSKKEISRDILPSIILGIKESSDPVDMTDIIKNSKVDSGQDTFRDATLGFEESTMNSDTLLNLTNDFSETLLFTSYLGEHFSQYNYESLEETSKVLEYELEYIIMGKQTDAKNMNGVIMKLLLIRSMLNLGTIMFHKETTLKATEIATLFLGFTGIPILVSILKVLLLVILSVVESLVDVSAMLKGKKLPLIKSGDGLQVSIEDLFMLSKSMIIDKANKLQNTSNNLNLGYKEYLYLFLFLEDNKSKNYRAMDLIQENIQLNYDANFYIKNCIQGFAIDGTFEMNKKFVIMPFIHKMLQDVNEKYEYKTLKAYSY